MMKPIRHLDVKILTFVLALLPPPAFSEAIRIGDWELNERSDGSVCILTYKSWWNELTLEAYQWTSLEGIEKVYRIKIDSFNLLRKLGRWPQQIVVSAGSEQRNFYSAVIHWPDMEIIARVSDGLYAPRPIENSAADMRAFLHLISSGTKVQFSHAIHGEVFEILADGTNVAVSAFTRCMEENRL